MTKSADQKLIPVSVHIAHTAVSFPIQRHDNTIIVVSSALTRKTKSCNKKRFHKKKKKIKYKQDFKKK